MRCERIAGLGRHLSNLNKNAAKTYANQWFERILDDQQSEASQSQRCSSADAILMTLDNVAPKLVSIPSAHPLANNGRATLHGDRDHKHEARIARRVAGGAHEEIRVLLHQASDVVKKEGGKNDLIERIKRTKFFAPVNDLIDGILAEELYWQVSGTGSDIIWSGWRGAEGAGDIQGTD